MKNRPHLEACPFCGGEPSAILGYIRYLDEDGNYAEFEEDERIWFCACVYCPCCGCEIERKKLSTEHHDDEWYEQIKMDAVNSWNRRAKDAEVH